MEIDQRRVGIRRGKFDAIGARGPFDEDCPEDAERAPGGKEQEQEESTSVKTSGGSRSPPRPEDRGTGEAPSSSNQRPQRFHDPLENEKGGLHLFQQDGPTAWPAP